MTTPRVPNETAKRASALYHSGQLRGSSGSSTLKSTSYLGSEVNAVPRVVIRVTVRPRAMDWDCERREVWVAVNVSARSSSWSDSDEVGERSADEENSLSEGIELECDWVGESYWDRAMTGGMDFSGCAILKTGKNRLHEREERRPVDWTVFKSLY